MFFNLASQLITPLLWFWFIDGPSSLTGIISLVLSGLTSWFWFYDHLSLSHSDIFTAYRANGVSLQIRIITTLSFVLFMGVNVNVNVCKCICNWPLPIGAFQDQCKQTMINKHN